MWVTTSLMFSSLIQIPLRDFRSEAMICGFLWGLTPQTALNSCDLTFSFSSSKPIMILFSCSLSFLQPTFSCFARQKQSPPPPTPCNPCACILHRVPRGNTFFPSVGFNHIARCAQSKVCCLWTVGATITPPASSKTTNKCKIQALRGPSHAAKLCTLSHFVFQCTLLSTFFPLASSDALHKVLGEASHSDAVWCFCGRWAVIHAVMCVGLSLQLKKCSALAQHILWCWLSHPQTLSLHTYCLHSWVFSF